ELAAGLSNAEFKRNATEQHCQFLETGLNELQTQCQSLEQTVNQLEESRVTAANAQQSEREMWQAERSLYESQRTDLESSRNNTQSQFLELQTQHTDLQSRFTSLETQYSTLQSQFAGLEIKCGELQVEVTQGQQSARRGEELERDAAELRGRLEEVVTLRMTEQIAKEELIHQYEVQGERWQSEAHKWQLLAEETAGQLGPVKQQCSILEAQIVELQGAISAPFVSESEQQKSELLRAQIEDQKKDLAEARVRLQEEQAQLEKLLAETFAREESLARLEMELREREAACVDRATALEERSQRIAAQIAQFEAEQAAFARQQATIIQQMSSLEERVQELSSAGKTRSFPTFLVGREAGTPALLNGIGLARKSSNRELSTEANEPEVLAADGALPQNENALTADEPDLMMQRLMLAIQSKADGGESLVDTSSEVKESAPVKGRYTLPKFLDQATELARNEDLAGPTVQSVDQKSPAGPQFVNQNGGKPSPASNEDGDDSVEHYMNRLLSRIRGGNSPVAASSAPPTPQPAPSPACDPVTISEKVAEPKEYVPRTLAPEPPERLSLMRELANTAAKSAIHAHARKNRRREFKKRSLLALISLAGATTLFIAGYLTGSKIAFVASMGFLTACCFMSLRALVGSLGYVRQKRRAEAAQRQGEENNSRNDNAPKSEQK
ncbi:MAG: hypothetical protein K8R36_08505, partial [Planctomycetales bacterium]|nr:hypothetical protein [Planctomycetales bacterium]